jgi:DUF4097 and DUF4098 domain-containing protein YvlB
MSPKSYIIPVAITAAGFAWMFGKPALEKRGHEHAHAVSVSVAVPAVTDDWCREHQPSSRGWHCEVREFTLPAGGLTELNASPNGSVEVRGWDKSEVLVRAKIEGRARTPDAARALVSEVNLVTSGQTVEARGPKSGRGESWSVTYQAMVPVKSDLALRATNGNVDVTQVMGDLRVGSTNGNIRLEGVGGNVTGGTTNGSVVVELAGDKWVGDGVDVSTTNGSITLGIPEAYNGVLDAATTNGSISVDFPITVTGKIGRRLRAELGDGGATIRAVTTNGSVKIRKQ